jgi:hypothetical protein
MTEKTTIQDLNTKGNSALRCRYLPGKTTMGTLNVFEIFDQKNPSQPRSFFIFPACSQMYKFTAIPWHTYSSKGKEKYQKKTEV